MNIAAIGDNCIDIYEKLNKKHPTGNIVNTAINLKKLGANVSVITTTGNDSNGEWMIDTLKKENLDISHLKIAEGKTAITYMDIVNGDRIHGEYIEGVLENMSFSDDDIKFAETHDLVHTALWGKTEDILCKIKNVPISFDYADKLEHKIIIDKTLEYVTYAFFSYHNKRDSYIEDFLEDKVNKGIKIAIATLGEYGSIAYDGKNLFSFDIFNANVVNTVGAGDSFIAGFLFSILSGKSVEKSLELGAYVASKVISVFEPWVD